MSLLGTREAASCVAQGCPRRIAGRSLRACCFRAVAAVPASAPAYGRRAKPGSQAFRAVAAVPASAPACGRRAKPGSQAFRAVAAVPASAPAYGRRAKPGSQAFRAVAAVPASAPACGRRAKPGSQGHLLSRRRRRPGVGTGLRSPAMRHGQSLAEATLPRIASQ